MERKYPWVSLFEGLNSMQELFLGKERVSSFQRCPWQGVPIHSVYTRSPTESYAVNSYCTRVLAYVCSLQIRATLSKSPTYAEVSL